MLARREDLLNQHGEAGRRSVWAVRFGRKRVDTARQRINAAVANNDYVQPVDTATVNRTGGTIFAAVGVNGTYTLGKGLTLNATGTLNFNNSNTATLDNQGVINANGTLTYTVPAAFVAEAAFPLTIDPVIVRGKA